MLGIGTHRELVLPPVTQNPALPNQQVQPGQQPGQTTAQPGQPSAANPNQPRNQPQQPEVKKKRGFWKHLFGGKNKNDGTTTSTDTNQ
jgi:hypothetical protein